ncbi:tail fiber domain-containing protein, partial [Limnobacter sp.]|uniref:tail fiber domain-containing protein n=1 Tax=Limnobacter sp. TaxID=2003368 RepID=UPI0025BE443D
CVDTGSDGHILFDTEGSERMRIDSSGRVGIGTSLPGARLEVVGSDDANNLVVSSGNTDFAVYNDDTIGEARLVAEDGTTNNNPKFLTLYTQASGASSPTERMRIDSSGFVGIGETSPQNNGGGQLTVKRSSTATTGLNGVLRLKQGSATNGNRASLVFSSLDNFNVAAVNGVIETHAGSESNNVGRLEFYTKASGSSIAERMRIKSDGKIGFNTAIPPRDYCFHSGQADTNIQITNNTTGVDDSAGALIQQDGNDLYIWNKENSFFSFGTNAVERMRIDSSGRLLVGSSSARANFFNSVVAPHLQIEGAGDFNRQSAIISSSSNAAFGAVQILAHQKSGAVGGNTLVSSGDQLGLTSFQGSDGAQFVEGARIEAFVDGTPGSNDMPGRLVFSTTADGATSTTERMRITKNGHIQLGGVTTQVPGLGNTTVGCAYEHLGGNGGAFFASRADGPAYFGNRNNDGALHECRRSGNLVGTISVNSSSTAYNTSSDYRLKENVVALSGAITRVKQLAPKRFNFIVDPDATVDGFLAHEAATVVPEAVTGTHNEVDAENNPVYQGIDQSKLVPLLTAALQEAIAKIETLETKVAALEAQ